MQNPKTPLPVTSDDWIRSIHRELDRSDIFTSLPILVHQPQAAVRAAQGVFNGSFSGLKGFLVQRFTVGNDELRSCSPDRVAAIASRCARRRARATQSTVAAWLLSAFLIAMSTGGLWWRSRQTLAASVYDSAIG